ncbi:MAG: ATP synthase subunit C [Candidatus Promineifilaceae bacterium]|nr:ATP synthase subunit C [Candidatus Promineifilaceae bacterium]
MMLLGISLGLAILLLIGRRLSARNRARSLVGGFLLLDAGLLLAALVIGALLWLGTPVPVAAAPPMQEGEGVSGFVALSAALSTGLAALGAGIAVAIAGSAAIGGITERPEIFGRALVIVGLAEGIAIYGLIISFFILTQ